MVTAAAFSHKNERSQAGITSPDEPEGAHLESTSWSKELTVGVVTDLDGINSCSACKCHNFGI